MAKRSRHRNRRHSGLLLLLALTMLLHTGARAAEDISTELDISAAEVISTVDPVASPENVSAVLYNNTNGLPTSEANAIVQTGDGFLWIGSYGGLIRYDGNTFVRMDSTSGLTSIKCLYVDRQDRLWIGTNDNGVAVLEKGEVRKWGKLDGMKSAHTRAITGDQNGYVYVATTCGIALIDADGNLRMMEEERIAEANMRDLKMGGDGIIYGLSNFGDLMKIKDGRLISFLPAEESPVQGVACMLPDPTKPGGLWFEAGDYGFYHGTYGENLTDLKPIDIQPLNTVQHMEYIDGRLWVCATHGIGVLTEDGFRVLDDLPMNNSIVHMMRDYLGNLWFTSTRQGVMKVVPNQFSNLFERYGLPERVVNSTCMYEGQLFVATDTGLMVLNENGPVSSLPLTKAVTNTGAAFQADAGVDDLIRLLDGCRIRSILRDSQNRLWISTWRKYGLLRYDRGELTVFAQGDGPLSNSMRAVCERRDGTILVALVGGVNVIHGDRIVASYGEADGIENTESLTVAEGTNGDIVLGSNGGGIYIINESGVRNINVEDGLPSDIVMRLKRDPKRDLIWIVTSSAIAYMTPDYQVKTVQKFPYSNNFDLFENSKGDMWVLSSNGIYVVPTEEMIANGEIHPVYYSIANGLPCTTTANSYSELTDEGDLYISGTTCICKVNIEKPFEDVEELKVNVPFVEVDGRTVYPQEDGGFTIPSDTQKLTVYSYVFNYSLSDPQVKYQLEGLEQSGTTIRRSDMVPVDYTNLRGGTYHYTMQLKDAMGRGDREVSVRIVKVKAFYERAWFYLLVGLATAIVIALLVRAYVRRKMRALEARHREEAKRERIENELQLATNIQAGVLPHTFPPFPDRHEFDIYASMTPAKEVGGDFYDFFLIDEDHLGLVMADVSGKGVPAALFMMVSRALIRAHLQNGDSPAQALAHANEQLCEGNGAELFVTVWAAVLEISTGRGVAANAGHEHPALRRANGAYELQIYRHSPAVATMEGLRFREHEFQLDPGDSLFVYTDGVAEATNAANELFGNERMLAALNVDPDAKPETVLSNVMLGIDAFVANAEQFDDITMLCLKYNGPADRGA